ncbi:MAG: hypothetical protein HYZ75_04745 [Elusimicrobia bacterium]|nr:hypothetical protein [Elusimicrobiota bacterium]
MATDTTTTVDEMLAELLEKKAPVDNAPDAVEEDEPDLDKLSQKAPPKEGICRRCGEDKPINRVMLCYVCWVKSNLEEQGWREGKPHPASCQCEVPGGHVERRSAGN